MSVAISTALQAAIAGWFVAVALVLLAGWLGGGREPAKGRLALAMGLIATTAVAFTIEVTTNSYGPLPALTNITFGLSGFAFLSVRDALIPLRAATRRFALRATLVSCALAAAASTSGNKSFTIAGSIALVGVWTVCVVEPVIRFWAASSGLPAVQRNRLRGLSLGYGAFIAVFVATAVEMTAVGIVRPNLTNLAEALVPTAVALPLVFIAFNPPAWLRRRWREGEEAAFRRALQELLLAKDDQRMLAKRSLGWAIRIVGARGGVFVSDGQVLASAGLSSSEEAAIASAPRAMDGKDGTGGWATRLITVEVPASPDAPRLVLVPGRFTPEIEDTSTLHEFAISVAATMERIRLINDLRRADQAKTEFLSHMSHELRTPLNAILGFAQLQAMEPLTPDQHARVERILRSGRQLLELVDQVLDYSRIETVRMTVAIERCSVEEAIRQALQLVAPAASRSGIVLEFATPPGDAQVLADLQRLVQILVNLLINAINYNRDSGSVRVQVEGWDERVRIHVVDTGRGIPASAQSRLFLPFDRLGMERSRINGAGIGLAVSRSLAELMHGTIGFTSQEGAGSDFWVELPSALPLAPPARSRPLGGLDQEAIDLHPQQFEINRLGHE